MNATLSKRVSIQSAGVILYIACTRTEAAATLIPVRSHRQAMDWSLVLASQAIETSIQFLEDSGGWFLAVAPTDYDRARDAIRQYQFENRGWRWQRRLVLPEIVFDAGSLAWALLMAAFYAISVHSPSLRESAIMDNAAVSRGEIWRFFTAILLHQDISHLASNLAVGFVLLGLAMGRYGTGIGLLGSYVAGAAGNLLVWFLCVPAHQNLGASGMVMGALGLLAAQSITLWHHTRLQARSIFTAVAGGALLFVLLGVSPGSDVVAHAGGFVAGTGIGVALARAQALTRNGKANLAAGLLFAGIVIGSWWPALR